MKDQQLGLLIYRGGSVCYNSYFDNTTAEAICRQMSFSSALEWTTEIESDIQLRYQPTIRISCSVADWDPKNCYFEEVAWFEDGCYDKMDVFLSCTG